MDSRELEALGWQLYVPFLSVVGKDLDMTEL
jgi:hypothetical protein